MAKSNLYWEGMLTRGNCADVAELLRQLLEGRSFVVVKTTARFNWKPEVVTGMTLCADNDGKAITVDHNLAGSCPATDLTIRYGNAFWKSTTRLTEDHNDPDFMNPHVQFEGERVTITDRLFEGHKAHIQFVVIA